MDISYIIKKYKYWLIVIVIWNQVQVLNSPAVMREPICETKVSH